MMIRRLTCLVFGVVLSFVLAGCTRSPGKKRIEMETRVSIEKAWAESPEMKEKNIRIVAINLEPKTNVKDQYEGTLTVAGKDWQEDVRVSVSFDDETIKWTLDRWAMKK